MNQPKSGWADSRKKAVECEYEEYDRKLTELFIHRLDDSGMTSEILREVSTSEDINDAIDK